MRYRVLATDYDGTLATDGRVDETTLKALEALRCSGHQAVLVTGREIADLASVFSRFDLFDLVVGENGALLYGPASRKVRLLCKPPPPAFIEALQARGVQPLATGRVVVATWTPNETAVFETIRDLQLELAVTFNKGAVMVLPPGVDKGSGLKAALDQLGLPPGVAVAIGDAENDEPMLALCGYAVAVANALPELKEKADTVTCEERGAGVIELISELLESDLRSVDDRK